MRDKKAQINTLAPAILALVFAAIVLVFGIVISQELRDTTYGDVSVTVANESIDAFVGTVNQSLDGAAKCGFGTITTANVVVYNETADYLIPATNYTAYSDGNIINASGPEDIYAWQVSYDYTWGDEACEGANSTVVGLGTFADFWEIIVLAIVITVVIGLLLVIFGGAGGRRR